MFKNKILTRLFYAVILIVILGAVTNAYASSALFRSLRAETANSNAAASSSDLQTSLVEQDSPPQRGAGSDASPEAGIPALEPAQVQGQAGTSFQQALNTAIQDRQAQGLPVPASISFEYNLGAQADPYANQLALAKEGEIHVTVTSKTVVTMNHPSQAGYEKWPDLIVEDSGLDGADGSVKPGNYNQAVRDWLAEQLPGIWDQYEYGYEPRQYTFTETLEINYSEAKIEALAAALADAADAAAVDEILLGFSYVGPDYDYTIEQEFETCLIFCVTWAEFKAGFAFDYGLGLRLPMEVTLNSPDPVTEGTPFNPTTSIDGVNWSPSDFSAAGVPVESGNEFYARFELFLGGSIKILGAEILGANIDETINSSSSFATPFGPGSSFSIPSIEVPVWQPSLVVADLTFGFGFTPNLGSDVITANWSAGGDASGAGTVTYTDANLATAFGPVNPINGPGQADLLVNNYRYWFSTFLMELFAYIDFDVFGFDAARIDIPITDFDLSFITGDLFVAAHTGTTDNIPLSVSILDLPATVDAGPDQLVDEGDLVSLAPATFVDLGVLDTHTATIDWGDGTVEPGTVVEAGGSGTVSGSHAYGDNGIYTVVVSVCEGLACGTDSLTVTASNVAPTTDAGPDQTVSEGDTVNLAPATFSDPGFLDTFSATIDWGDSSPTEAGTVNASGGSGEVSGSHVYLDDGLYTVTVEVCDDDGGCGADSFTVTVENVAPTVSPIQAPSAKLVGAQFSASATFTDPGILDTHTAEWDWGDGTVEPGTLTQGAGFGSVEDTHTYFTCQVFTIVLTVTDDDGGIGSSGPHNLASLSPEEGIAYLIDMVEALGLPHGIENALVSKLTNALAAMERGQDNAAENMLNAFINQVEAQSGKKIAEGDADALIQWAEDIIAASEAGLCAGP